jgi:hypothetical protein
MVTVVVAVEPPKVAVTTTILPEDPAEEVAMKFP